MWVKVDYSNLRCVKDLTFCHPYYMYHTIPYQFNPDKTAGHSTVHLLAQKSIVKEGALEQNSVDQTMQPSFAIPRSIIITLFIKSTINV